MANQNGLGSRNALIVKIALFLNFLSKENYNRLLKEIKTHPNPAFVDILKLMAARQFVSPKDIPQLKHTCLNFAKAQEDQRFGSLCIEFNFLTQSNLDLALEEQQKLIENKNHIRIGELLVEAGMLSQRQKNLILQKQKVEALAKGAAAGGETPSGNSRAASQKNEEPFDPRDVREIRESDIILFIQNDGLKAFIRKTDRFDDRIPLDDLKLLLEKNGIIYGISDDDRLEGFIKNPKYKTAFFEVAKGLAPIDGTDAKIVYMFETDYLKAGTLFEDGTMDFKDRGDIPFITQGDVLAEKIPPKTGKDGVNIFGDVVPQVEAADISFSLGKEVRLTKDGLKVIATADGNPKVKPGGEISVNSAYFIEGDVDYNTGHVKFDKNVYITGSIKSGFRVEAIDVIASNIDGGIVKAHGDVFVQNGIVESAIEAKGNIKAGFVHNSKAKCLGDMIIVKEVVDTDILIEGTFEMTRGKILSSTLCAKGGAKVYAIGSEKSNPSHITVGTSLYMEKELQAIDQSIEQRQNLLENITMEKNKTESELTLIDEKLENFDTGQKIHALQDQKAMLEKQLTRTKNDIAVQAEAVKLRVKEKFTLKRLNQRNPSKPILDVSGKAFAGNKISGRHASLVLTRNISHSRIMEIEHAADNARSGWEMVVTTL